MSAVRFLLNAAQGMTYTSAAYWLMVAVLILIYFILPKRVRYLALLAGSLVFYWSASSAGRKIFLLTMAVSYVFGIILERFSSKILLFAALIVCMGPLLMVNFHAYGLLRTGNVVAPLGLSFYSLQIVSYLVDIYKEKIRAQKNPFKYALFVSYFPQILQGPIPRYEQLGSQLFEGHSFDARRFVRGCQLILWGFFLKFVIADKAGIAVNAVFGSTDYYVGQYVLLGGALYAFQLYTDFMSCVELSRGVSEIFGIELANNFNHPYFATSVQDFWRRWHISLSSWLRDYVYIPLGGNRKGKFRQYVNIVITFLVSGLWHGQGVHYIVWGLLHAFYQLVEKFLMPARKKIASFLKMPFGSLAWTCVRVPWTFFRVTLAWILFRAPSLTQGISMLQSLFTIRNPWIWFDGSLLQLGLDEKQWHVLGYGMLVLLFVSICQEHVNIRDWILRQHLIIRWTLYIAAVTAVVLFGTYGYGYDASAFIYGNF